MVDFQATINLLALAEHQPPRQVNLLLYDARKGRQATGWAGADGGIVLVGGNWQPTHFAVAVERVLNEAEIQARGTDEPVYQCPTVPDSVMPGCGLLFTSRPDEDGQLNCPRCGKWFEQPAAPGAASV